MQPIHIPCGGDIFHVWSDSLVERVCGDVRCALGSMCFLQQKHIQYGVDTFWLCWRRLETNILLKGVLVTLEIHSAAVGLLQVSQAAAAHTAGAGAQQEPVLAEGEPQLAPDEMEVTVSLKDNGMALLSTAAPDFEWQAGSAAVDLRWAALSAGCMHHAPLHVSCMWQQTRLHCA